MPHQSRFDTICPTSETAIPAASKAQEDAPDQNGRYLAMAAHVSLLCGFVSPIASAIISGALLYTHADSYPFVARHAKEALNLSLFLSAISLAMLIIGFLAGLGTLVMPEESPSLFMGLGVGLGWVVWFASFIFGLAMGAKGAKAAGEGREFRYPDFVPRWVK